MRIIKVNFWDGSFLYLLEQEATYEVLSSIFDFERSKYTDAQISALEKQGKILAQVDVVGIEEIDEKEFSQFVSHVMPLI